MQSISGTQDWEVPMQHRAQKLCCNQVACMVNN
jgi:hypothetical protein